MYFATLKEVTWGCCVEINGSDIFVVILLPIIRKVEHYPFSNNYYYYKSRHIIRDMVVNCDAHFHDIKHTRYT